MRTSFVQEPDLSRGQRLAFLDHIGQLGNLLVVRGDFLVDFAVGRGCVVAIRLGGTLSFGIETGGNPQAAGFDRPRCCSGGCARCGPGSRACACGGGRRGAGPSSGACQSPVPDPVPVPVLSMIVMEGRSSPIRGVAVGCAVGVLAATVGAGVLAAVAATWVVAASSSPSPQATASANNSAMTGKRTHESLEYHCLGGLFR